MIDVLYWVVWPWYDCNCVCVCMWLCHGVYNDIVSYMTVFVHPAACVNLSCMHTCVCIILLLVNPLVNCLSIALGINLPIIPSLVLTHHLMFVRYWPMTMQWLCLCIQLYACTCHALHRCVCISHSELLINRDQQFFFSSCPSPDVRCWPVMCSWHITLYYTSVQVSWNLSKLLEVRRGNFLLHCTVSHKLH